MNGLITNAFLLIFAKDANIIVNMKSCLCSVLFILCCLAGRGQDYFRQADIYDMRLLNRQSGLSNNTLAGICQDVDGFIWLGTDMGLDRYDGIHFHNYNWKEKEPFTVGPILEDANHLLWFQVEGQRRIACFDKTQGRYLPLVSDTPEALADMQGIIRLGDKLYVSTAKGIAQLEVRPAEGEVNVSLHYLSGTPKDIVRLRGLGNCIYALTSTRKIVTYHVDTRKQDVVSSDDLHISADIPIDDIYAFNGYIWICLRWSEGICYDPASGQSAQVVYTNGQSENNSTYIRDISQVDDRTFIVATRNALYKLTFDGEDFIHSGYHIAGLSSELERYAPALDNGITQIYFDRQNSVLWVGTFGRGVLKLNIGKRLLHHIKMEDREPQVIKSITQDAGGYVWLATEQNGIYRSTGHELSAGMQFARWDKVQADNHCCLYKDKNGALWIGGSGGNVFCMNPLSGETIAYHPLWENGASLGAISGLYLNTRGYLWIISGKGLFVYDYKNNKVLNHIPYSDKLAPVTAICEDGAGLMWLGTEKGLVTLKYEKGRADVQGGYEADAKLRTGEVLALYINNYNQIFASYANKILQIDGKEKKVVSSLLLGRDFTNGHVNCMIDDGNGNTWLGTNAGLITISNKNASSYNYAFPENYYNVCLLDNGYLLWASSSGLSYFDPRLMKEESGGSGLYLSDIDVNYKNVEIGEEVNGQVILDKPAYQTAHLDLNYRNNNLVIYLSDLKYGNVSNRVEYRLLPAHDGWTGSSNNQVSLSNLEHGDYTLEIRSVSPLEAETKITTLTISVGEYWAASVWAIVLYFLIGAALLFFAWHYLTHKEMKKRFYLAEKEKLKQKLEEEKKRRERNENINLMRDQVRLGLAKELRTPLSLIIAPLKEMMEAKDFPGSLLPKAEIAYRSSVSIQDICNQLLSINQHRSSDNQLKVASYKAGELADSIVHSFYELLNSCPITLYYDKEKKVDTEVWVDHKKMEFILQCIFSNAYRHISYSGSIWFTVTMAEIDHTPYCLFTVKDDGKNVEESSVVYLSKTGYDVDDKSVYRELAMDVMKDMALVHHGDIKIDRQKDTGTTVTLYIPLGKEHFAGDKNVSFVEPDHIALDSQADEEVNILLEETEMSTGEVKPLQEALSDKKHTLLIIEDSIDIRTYLRILYSSTYNVLLAENGKQGLALARSEMPDLIITDVMMPGGMDGFECCRILKEDLSTCHIPVIILTALSDEEDMAKGLELGADEYIYKPFNPEILRLKVKRLIKSRMELKQVYAKLLMPSDADSGQEDGEVPEAKAEDPFIEEILEIANQNLQNPNFSVKWLAEKLNMSQATLYRRIKQSTDFSLVELIRGVRLKRAAELLRTKKYSVQEVAEMVGYNDAPTFRKHFVDFYGTTPSTFNNKPSEE